MARDVIDFSFSRVRNIAEMKAAGIKGVMRYVSPNPPKNLEAWEIKEFRENGIDICVNYEWYAERPREGYAAGVEDARIALNLCNQLGYPGVVYAAIDFDARESEQPTINEYMRGYISVLGDRGKAAYGGYYVIKRLFDAGIINYGWQTYAWSGGQWDPRAQLRQVLNGQQLAGATIDYNESMSDYGQWKADNSVQVTPTPVPQGPSLPNDTDYTVVRGDTLGAIASRWGTSVDAIIVANKAKYPNIGSGKNSLIIAGWVLTRPGSVPPASVGTGQYVVVSGDTLGALASAWGTSVEAIISVNRGAYPNIGTGKNSLIGVGWVLSKPGNSATAPAPTPPASPNRTHLVASGQTLGQIGAIYGVNWRTIVNINRGRYPTIGTGTDDHIEAGWTILIP